MWVSPPVPASAHAQIQLQELKDQLVKIADLPKRAQYILFPETCGHAGPDCTFPGQGGSNQGLPTQEILFVTLKERFPQAPERNLSLQLIAGQ